MRLRLPRLMTVISLLIGVALVVVPATLLLAQDGFGPNASSFVNDIWTAARQAGPFAALLTTYMWLRSEAERRKLQDERDELLERVLTGMNSSTTALQDLRRFFTAGRHDAT